MGWYREWRPYVPVAKRKANSAAFAQKLAKKEKRQLAPVLIAGKKIAATFWGQAWMDNLEHYSDFANRLPRGRTYVRNGSVIDLCIERGLIKAIVSGSEIYRIKVAIDTLSSAAWKQIKRDCAHSIDSLIDLLSGKFDQGVMQRLTRADGGLFPKPNEIKMQCSCPDNATLCKHVAAVMYGVGARLDASPELLFTLRDVDHTDLIQQATSGKNIDRMLATSKPDALGSQDLGELFGIELEESSGAPNGAKPGKKKTVRPASPAKKNTKPKGKAPARAAAAKPARKKVHAAAGDDPIATGEKKKTAKAPAKKTRAKTTR